MDRAVVVGSGPNGLSAAITLAAAGLDVTVLEASDSPGGGTRSVEATVPGLVHDECSQAHPLAVDTAFARAHDLAAYGLRWAYAPVEYAHPLDGGGGAAVWRSVRETAEALGADRDAYRRMFGPLTERFDRIAAEFSQPMLQVPRHPLALGRFGAYAAMPASVLARRFNTEEGRALWAGVAAHAFRPLGSFMSSAIGAALGTAAHRYGWPVAVGGSEAISRAMIAKLESLGGSVETGRLVTSLHELDGADIIMLNLAPRAAADVIGSRLPPRIERALRGFKHGPGALQVSYAVDGPVPWEYEPAGRAGTVHLGGSFDQIATAERATWRGNVPRRPFVLVGQQSIADPTRAANGLHPIDAYAHVPAGYAGDSARIVTDQIERFAPGFTSRVVVSRVNSARTISALNANFVGGDITTGANTARQLIARPRLSTDPYSTGVPGVFLCSAATPPGAGAHGMCGWNAARSALRTA